MAVEVINALLKIVIGRKRPRLDGLPPLASTRSQRSCPSAHASSSFAAARVLSQALPVAPVYAAAFAMALSRPYLGVHYPSDIVAGMLLGTVVAASVSGSPDDGSEERRSATARSRRPGRVRHTSARSDKNHRKLQLLLQRLP